jgi:Flp pilus assembly protein TadB
VLVVLPIYFAKSDALAYTLTFGVDGLLSFAQGIVSITKRLREAEEISSQQWGRRTPLVSNHPSMRATSSSDSFCKKWLTAPARRKMKIASPLVVCVGVGVCVCGWVGGWVGGAYVCVGCVCVCGWVYVCVCVCVCMCV